MYLIYVLNLAVFWEKHWKEKKNITEIFLGGGSVWYHFTTLV